ncbi:hypothetical protein [Fructilactobacillus lindneri]|nr:hypothetical protein [Fructilactobacillus lindneri]SKA08837.1 hypothetical protein SAMN02746042_01439 [Fructilactobacillus lindneri DSM 20690 = JCM 11027]
MIIKDFKDFYVIVTDTKDFIVKKENCTIDVREEATGEHKYL